MGDSSVSRVENNAITTRNGAVDLVAFLTKAIDDYAIDKMDATAIQHDQYGNVTIQNPRILLNNNREQCPICDKYYSDRSMLERHYFDTTRECTRCRKETWATCKYGLEAWSRRPQCNFGCEECMLCFNREEQQEQHDRDCHDGKRYGCQDTRQKVPSCCGDGGKVRHTRRKR
ncbi:hypothetical protein BDZ45DRAFT_744305 [Acephala macrosclerotiorum]|nr:hypothetical protein BDZ45DRAFT_744305 [Acephala macrosclerotiorum]